MGRGSLYVGILAVVFGTTSGTVLGAISAYYGGKVDLIVQRLIDSLMAFPALFFAMALMAVLGTSIQNVIVSLSIVSVPLITRVVRAAAVSISQTQYVDAARAIGANSVRIMLFHVLPNCFAPIIVMASILLGWAIVVEASLSFLGVGIPFNVPSWGGMLGGEARQYFRSAPWLVVFPGLALSATVLGINVLGDALRDYLDPRLRGTGPVGR